MRLSLLGLKVVDNSITQILNRIHNPNAKVLVLDCDNTLWGGVIGEDGLSKIVIGSDGIGKAYSDFQKSIIKLQKSGIILAICSKNNACDVWDVFKNHPEMILKKNKSARSSMVIPQNPEDPETVILYRSDNEDEGIEFTYTYWMLIDNYEYKTNEWKHICLVWHTVSSSVLCR